MTDFFRTREMAAQYREYRAQKIESGACDLCLKPAIKEFSYWKIVPNDFPYDRIAALHEMIIPVRLTTGAGLTEEETEELKAIKESYLQT